MSSVDARRSSEHEVAVASGSVHRHTERSLPRAGHRSSSADMSKASTRGSLVRHDNLRYRLALLSVATIAFEKEDVIHGYGVRSEPRTLRPRPCRPPSSGRTQATPSAPDHWWPPWFQRRLCAHSARSEWHPSASATGPEALALLPKPRRQHPSHPRPACVMETASARPSNDEYLHRDLLLRGRSPRREPRPAPPGPQEVLGSHRVTTEPRLAVPALYATARYLPGGPAGKLDPASPRRGDPGDPCASRDENTPPHR